MGVTRGVRDRLRLRGRDDEGAPGAVPDEAAEQDARARREAESLELRERIAAQWAEVRAARRAMDTRPEVAAGTSNFKRAQVPYGMDLAAAWAWRFVVVCAAGLIILYLLQFFMVVVLPIVIALLIAALVSPVVRWLGRLGVPRGGGALIVVLLLLALVALSVTFVGNQVAQGVSDLSTQVGSGLEQIRSWLRDGPLGVTDSQINTALQESQAQLQSLGDNAYATLSELGATVGHLLAGVFIVLFATYFFLADGALIWTWLVRLFPRAGRLKADSSGRVAWSSLTQFVRATVLVAAVDALGIAIGAAVLGVPFVGAIGVLVFLGAFVPMIGATISGAVAVLVALVAQGPVTAAVMLGVVIAVQQLEAHVLQPFLMGRFVSVHPLGVIVAIAMGVLVAGIAGALIAVPLAASLNAVVQHLARDTAVGEDAQEAAEDDAALHPGGEPA
ncbi:AI-2E family transporter [Marmoricola sp. Leaf446]|uniref:AI-2E family transporter n=1 Tax=Marmoricola sp. Leaf446 TaxID=1736379 RepID=UPI001F2D0438|nr:AI-2E family transporter [Marmoricola sp. Leaf446]